MRTTRRLATIAATLLLLASVTQAHDHLKLKSGRTLKGEATAYDPETHLVTFVTLSGEVLQIAAADLDRVSAYKLAKAKAEAGNAEDELKLGDLARDIELYAHSNRHYGNAEKLQPSLAARVEEKRVRLRTEAAAYCMRNASEAKARGDTREVEEWLTKLVEKLPDEPLAAEAAAMLSEAYRKNHAEKDDHLEQAHFELLAEELQKGKKYYDEMLESIHKGLTSDRASSAVKREFERAWNYGEKALKELERVRKKLEKERMDVGEAFDGYRDLVHEHMIASQLHLASMLTVQSNYKDAQRAVSRALALDPKNMEALAARARIENASSRGWRW